MFRAYLWGKGSTGVAQIGERKHVRINGRNRGGVIGVSRGESSSTETGWTGSSLHASSPPALIHSQQQQGGKSTCNKGPLVQKATQKCRKMDNIMESMVIVTYFIQTSCMYVFFGSLKDSLWNLWRCVFCFGWNWTAVGMFSLDWEKTGMCLCKQRLLLCWLQTGVSMFARAQSAFMSSLSARATICNLKSCLWAPLS